VISLSVATLLLGSLAAPAAAGTLSAKKAEAKAVAAQVVTLDKQLGQAVAEYAAAVRQLERVQAGVRDNQRQLKLAEYQLNLAQQELAAHVVTTYKGGDASLLNALLQTGTFDDLLTRLDYVRHLARGDAGVVQTVEHRRQQVLADRGSLRKALAAAKRTADELGAARTLVRSQLDQRHALLAGLNADIKRLASVQVVRPVAKSGTNTPPPAPDPGGGSGPWWSAIKSAAAANGIWAEGLNRLMLAESGGSAGATNGPFCGLFQYTRGTWKGSWNPYRTADIFDGGAQIKATALAVRLGYGASWWPSTYPWAFSRQ
jgi:hypothetical protein